MVTKIPLTRGLFSVVDDADAPLVQEYKWYALRSRRTFYAVRSVNKPNGKQTKVQMHTLLTGFPVTDHIDGDGLNNRRNNLRASSVKENQWNNRKQLNTSSQYKGVTLHKGINKFQAAITTPSLDGPGKNKYLGVFASEIEAAIAYDNAARELFGNFTALNFPMTGERSALADGIEICLTMGDAHE